MMNELINKLFKKVFVVQRRLHWVCSYLEKTFFFWTLNICELEIGGKSE